MTIQWNKVTWYSKLIAVVIFLLTFYVGFSLGEMKAEINTSETDKSPVVVNTNNTNLQNGKYCFSRTQVATTTEPYNVEEHIVLNVNGDLATGTKNGTQSGPDLTNGYQGDLKGSVIGNTLELVYSYIVEGSANKELEIYNYNDGTLVKSRWTLVEKNKMLVPDKTGTPKLISYQSEKCTQ